MNSKLLNDGLNRLCGSDETINSLIAPRKEEIIVLLGRYIKEIETFNDAYGLVKIKNTDELITRHILDSLAPVGIIAGLLKTCCNDGVPKIADAGSGAGFPGIPLAIAIPDCNFNLIERMGRRAGFLFNTAGVLGLKNINIIEKELEQTENDQFNIITFRAFSPLEPKIIKTLFKVCRKNGVIAAYKGQLEKIKQEIYSIEKLCGQTEIIQYEVPFLNEQRHLAVIRNKA